MAFGKATSGKRARRRSARRRALFRMRRLVLLSPSRATNSPPMMRRVDTAAERLEIRTADGRGLGAELQEPRGRRILGTVVFAHPMFANRSVFARPRGGGVAQLFFEAGWRTITFDFRGHGESTCGGKATTPEEAPWTYDDLGADRPPAVVEAAPRSLAPFAAGRRALARRPRRARRRGGGAPRRGRADCRGGERVDAPPRAVAPRLAPQGRDDLAMAAVATRHRYLPVRALRLGTDDEAAPYIDDLARFALHGRWTSRDGAVDYEAGLARIAAPTFALTSAGDRLYCRRSRARACSSASRGARSTRSSRTTGRSAARPHGSRDRRGVADWLASRARVARRAAGAPGAQAVTATACRRAPRAGFGHRP